MPPDALDQLIAYSPSNNEGIASRLDKAEEFWRDHTAWLEEHGYVLRPRYRRSWSPSWREKGSKTHWTLAEDSMVSGAVVLDATRSSDGKFVTLKKIPASSPQEVEIAQYLSSAELSADIRNHSVPVLDTLQVPESSTQILVMPLLKEFRKPRFQTIGEVVAFLTQCFEGLEFMHEKGVAHLDCNGNNIMMDASPLYPKPYHPVDPLRRRDWKGSAKHLFRTQRPVKYYFIDFGLSRRFSPEDDHALWEPIRGGDKSVPEHQGLLYWRPSNPFSTDVYYLGNMIRKELIQECRGLEFMESLVQDMVHENPCKRPPIDIAARRFREIRSSLSSPKLRSRVVYRRETLSKLWRPWRHWFMTLTYIVMRKSAIPDA
ncbi:hypothetical protein OF83DRAFT_1164907 [Amylostereum chailletii]|nr:hypothetical protein OF83DRAFT_1164907 [Amylostereum chailletii]